MAAKYILAVVGCAFLILGLLRVVRDGGRLNPQGRTWLLVGAIFAAVSTWLFTRE